MPMDQIDRSSETPLTARFRLCGVEVDLSTNDLAIIDRLQNLLPSSTASTRSRVISAWRIVVEELEDAFEWHEPLSVHSLKEQGIAFIAIGPKSFLAYDWETRRGVSFCSANLVRDEARFMHYFVPSLFAILEQSRETS